MDIFEPDNAHINKKLEPEFDAYEFDTKTEKIIKAFDSEKRIVLFEKAPFLVEHYSKKLSFMVRKLTTNDWNSNIEYSSGFDFNTELIYRKNCFYKIVDFGKKKSKTNFLHDLGCWIMTQDYKKP